MHKPLKPIKILIICYVLIVFALCVIVALIIAGNLNS